MAALAEILLNRGADITGSDTDEKFYTDDILRQLQIPLFEGFSSTNVPRNAQLVIYSAAYNPESNPELAEAQQRGIPLMLYTEALGSLSIHADASGIAGVHGKTTTTALTGTLVKKLCLPATVLVGSAVAGFGGRSTFVNGDTYFIAETCEYKRHFLQFHPDRIIITSLELDHQDYYTSYADIESAFLEYCLSLPTGGEIFYYADSTNVVNLIEKVKKNRSDIQLTPYGFSAEGAYRITESRVQNERLVFSIAGAPKQLTLRVPGIHNVQNATAAAALAASLYIKETGNQPDTAFWNAAESAFDFFKGSKRRSEIIGEAGGILFADDYGHHPTAIKSTIQGFKDFYPNRRLIVDFMSHTYSRTAALLEDFAKSLEQADEVILHKIYASAREQYTGSITGKDLFKKVAELHPKASYFHDVEDAEEYLKKNLSPGDLFLSMGAGNNWQLSHNLYSFYS